MQTKGTAYLMRSRYLNKKVKQIMKKICSMNSSVPFLNKIENLNN